MRTSYAIGVGVVVGALTASAFGFAYAGGDVPVLRTVAGQQSAAGQNSAGQSPGGQSVGQQGELQPQGPATGTDTTDAREVKDEPEESTESTRGSRHQEPQRKDIAPGEPGPSGPWLPPVTYSRGGGFDGRTVTITINPRGEWKRTDSRAGTRTGELSIGEKLNLNELLRSDRLEEEAEQGGGSFPPPGNCPDGITQRVSTQGLTATSNCQNPMPPTWAKVTQLVVSYTES